MRINEALERRLRFRICFGISQTFIWIRFPAAVADTNLLTAETQFIWNFINRELEQELPFSIKSSWLAGMFEKILRMLSISFIVHRVECVAGRRSVQNKRANPSPESSFRTDLWRCLEMRRTSCRGQPKRTFPGNLLSLFALHPRVFLLSNSSREKFPHSRRKFEKSFLEVQRSLRRFFNFHTLYLILEFSILIPEISPTREPLKAKHFPFTTQKWSSIFNFRML